MASPDWLAEFADESTLPPVGRPAPKEDALDVFADESAAPAVADEAVVADQPTAAVEAVVEYEPAAAILLSAAETASTPATVPVAAPEPELRGVRRLPKLVLVAATVACVGAGTALYVGAPGLSDAGDTVVATHTTSVPAPDLGPLSAPPPASAPPVTAPSDDASGRASDPNGDAIAEPAVTLKTANESRNSKGAPDPRGTAAVATAAGIRSDTPPDKPPASVPPPVSLATTVNHSPAIPVTRPEILSPPPQPPAIGLPPATANGVPPASLGTLAPPPAPPSPPAAKPDPDAERVAEIAAIDGVLTRYRRAYSSLDVEAVSQVWPGVDSAGLTRAFNQLESQSVEFTWCEIDTHGTDAYAECTGQVSYIPTVGSRRPQVRPRHWRFVLSRTGGRWLIRTIETRAR